MAFQIIKTGLGRLVEPPRMTHEASGTSGMSGAMNGTVNISIPDGWFGEFARDGMNCFIISPAEGMSNDHERDGLESENLYNLPENEVIPTYYNKRSFWQSLMIKGMEDAIPYFDSN
jgi:starch phosphorylase